MKKASRKNQTSRQSHPDEKPASSKIPPLALRQSKIKADWFADPSLVFADGKLATDPKIGIPLFGPMSFNTLRHRKEIYAGIIATSQLAETVRNFYEELSTGVDGTSDYYPFPGCKQDRGYRTDVYFNDKLTEIIRVGAQLPGQPTRGRSRGGTFPCRKNEKGERIQMPDRNC